jgi:serine/threonine protein kinase
MNLIEDDARTVFLTLLECPPEQRMERLDEACRGNGELRARVNELLRAHEQMGSIHCGVRRGLMGIDGEDVHSEGPGAKIGAYKLLEQIGEGGFGVVYLAEQERPIKRRVALKIIKPGMDTRQVIARFEAERQALAMMDHPNIAKVLDAGTTGDQAVGQALPDGRTHEQISQSHPDLPASLLTPDPCPLVQAAPILSWSWSKGFRSPSIAISAT